MKEPEIIPGPGAGGPRFRNEPLAGHLPTDTLEAEFIDPPPGLPAKIEPEDPNAPPSLDSMGISPPLRAGLMMIAIVFGGFGTWAALAPLDSASIAQGGVGMDSPRRWPPRRPQRRGSAAGRCWRQRPGRGR